MQYWIHINGLQRGPMQLEELIKAGVTPDTYVWREGLEDWIKAKDLTELAGFFITPASPISAEPEQGKGDEFRNIQPQPETSYDNGTSIDTGSDYLTSSPSSEEQQSNANDNTTEENPPEPFARQHTAQARPILPQQAPSNQRNAMPPCPATNLAWAIITTALCCQIFGVIAIIYAAQVKSKYNLGQYDKALKYSERAELWCKLGIAFGLVWTTFYSIISPLLEML